MKFKALNFLRIGIYGGSGSGKSTLALELGKILNIPPIHIDDLFWLKDWVQEDHTKLVNKIEEITNKKYWIIDGNYSFLSKIVMNKATLIIIIRISIWKALWRLFNRTIVRRTNFNYIKVTPLPFNVRNSKPGESILSTFVILSKQLNFTFLNTDII